MEGRLFSYFSEINSAASTGREMPVIESLPPKSMTEILNALRGVLDCLIEDKNQLTLTVIPQAANHFVIQIHTTKGDAGRIIGKDGRNARALRTLVNSIGLRAGRTFSVDIVPR